MVEVAIIVTDAPPLITLAAAQSLDYLLYPALPVIIPDAVFHEATSAGGKLGAEEILAWYRAHTAQIRVAIGLLLNPQIDLRSIASSGISSLAQSWRAAQCNVLHVSAQLFGH